MSGPVSGRARIALPFILLIVLSCASEGVLETARGTLPALALLPTETDYPTMMPPIGSSPQPCSPSPLQPGPGQSRVRVYFHCGGTVDPVPRLVPTGGADVQLSAALVELLAGPTLDEQSLGYTSWFSPLTAGSLQSVSVGVDGQAVISFKDFSTAIPNASTAEGSRELIEELSKTIFQFEDVRVAQIQFDYDCERFWTWLQAASCTPIYPTD